MTCLSKLVPAVLLVCVALAGDGCRGRAAMPPPSEQAIADRPARSSEIASEASTVQRTWLRRSRTNDVTWSLTSCTTA